MAERCVEEYKKGNDVIVVLSAMGDTTDELIAKAKEINPNASRREMDMLLTTGEQVSVSLMAMAISSMGIPAVSNAFQVGDALYIRLRERGLNGSMRTASGMN